MKVPINAVACIDLDAPAAAGRAREGDGRRALARLVPALREWHYHGPAERHREAHCQDSSSPYWRSGYNLALRRGSCRMPAHNGGPHAPRH